MTRKCDLHKFTKSVFKKVQLTETSNGRQDSILFYALSICIMKIPIQII